MAAIVGNNVSSELAVGINNSVVSLSLIAGGGSLFPDISGTDANGDANYFYATLIDSAQELEVVKCTSVSGDTLTVTRAQEGTSARVFAAGNFIELRLTAAVLNDRYNKAETHAKIVELAPATDITGKLDKSGGTLTGDLTLNSGKKVIFGGNEDLQIYHDGYNGFIKEIGYGPLTLQGTDLNLKATDNTMYLKGDDGTATSLYHPDTANGVKLATTSTGITVTGTVAATAYTGDGSALTGIVSIPTGLISMWSGSAGAIPTGWNLCNGSNGTPNLVGKFIKGGSTAGATGGSTTTGAHTLTTAQMPSHNHSTGLYAKAGDPPSNNYYRYGYATSSVKYTASTGGGQSHSHSNTEPPYYELCYIMKT